MFAMPHFFGTIFTLGTAACQGDSGGPLSQMSNGKIFVLGIVSYGPKNCRNNEGRRPDVYTDVRFFARWIRSETSYYDQSRWSENTTRLSVLKNVSSEDSIEALVPNCGEDFCFESTTGGCTFIRSMYVKCEDKIECKTDLIPSLEAFVLGGRKTFTANSVGAVGFISRSRGRKRRCTKWKYIPRTGRWRCRSFKIIKRKRREVEEDYIKGLICPVLSCKNRAVITNDWSTPDDAEECELPPKTITNFTTQLPSQAGGSGKFPVAVQ